MKIFFTISFLSNNNSQSLSLTFIVIFSGLRTSFVWQMLVISSLGCNTLYNIILIFRVSWKKLLQDTQLIIALKIFLLHKKTVHSDARVHLLVERWTIICFCATFFFKINNKRGFQFNYKELSQNLLAALKLFSITLKIFKIWVDVVLKSMTLFCFRFELLFIVDDSSLF